MNGMGFLRGGMRQLQREMMRLAGTRGPFMIVGIITVVAGCGSPDRESEEAEMIITSDIACQSCSIALEGLVTLRDAASRGLHTAIARDEAGFTYLIDPHDQGKVKVYGDDGNFIRQIGRPGGGPGEYELIFHVLIGGDSVIHLLDRHLVRHSRFTRSGEFIDAVTVPRLAYGIGPAVILADNRIVLSGDANTPDPQGSLLQVVDQQGDALPLGGPIQGDPEKAWLNERLLWAREADGLLVADPFSFTIDIFDEKLAWNRRVRRVAEWIPADLPTEMADGVFDKPMNAALRSVWEDNEGVLWVTMTVPSPDWRPERPRPLSDPQETAALVKRPRLDTIVEAIDLDRGHVLARLRLPGPQGVFFGSGYLAKSVEDESLIEPQIQISRVRLDR